MILVFCDGSVTLGKWGKKDEKHLPAKCWFGWVAKQEDGTVIHAASAAMGEIPEASANVAEYSAVRAALLWLARNGYADQPIKIHSDSQLVINQLSGKWGAADDRMRKMRDQCREAAKKLRFVAYQWIPREENKEADQLSKALQSRK